MHDGIDHARELDSSDELARFRDEFVVHDSRLIYLDGNSLGALPRRTAMRLREVVDHEWGERLIRGWNEGWFTAAKRIGAKIAQLIGARSDEVIITDSTSVNLFKLALAALHARRDRRTIVSDELNFPSDLYVLDGIAQLAGSGGSLKIVRSDDGISVSIDALRSAMDRDTALVALTHVAFKSGAAYDIRAVTELAHRAGAWMLWDLSHSVGAMPLDMERSGVDLAVGCTYKYLHGGPGAPAFLYVRRDLQAQLVNPIRGWFGHRSQFDFSLDYEPATGIGRFQSGTPPILSLAAVEPGVDLVMEAGIERIRAKSLRQTEYLLALARQWLVPLGVSIRSPIGSAMRGSHVSLGHPDGYRVARSLIEDMNVIPDFRAPDNIRLGISPLATSFSEIHEAAARLRRVLSDRLFETFPPDRAAVT